MAEETTDRRAPGAESGSLIVRRDGTVVMAEQRASSILHAPDPEGLAGRDWTSLVAQSDTGTLPAARRALAGGRPWQGTLRYRYGYDEVTLHTTITPVDRSDDLAVIALEASVPQLPPARRGMPEPTEDGALRAQAAAQEAIQDLDGAPSVARAVLQSLSVAIPFDWGVVVRFQERHATHVVAVYPSAMAGIAMAATWPHTPAEASAFATGEPSLDGRLTRETDMGTPLSRLPAFGLASRVLIPLFAGADVAGAILIYRAGGAAFDAQDGLYAERIVRRLGPALRAPAGMHADPAAGPVAVEPQPAEAPHALTMGLESLGELVAGVAHELNNPLTAILGYAQILPALEDEERAHALHTIESEAQRAARIVRNLLAFARQRPGDRRDVDIETVLRRVIDLRRYSLEMDDVRVVTRFGHVPAVRVDEGQFEQVFLNLLNNAHHAVKGGGELVVGTWTRGDRLMISFADDGPGIPESLRARVFEPFFTTHEVGHGEGMGLAIVYGVVAAHDGKTWVEPSPSGGANFFIELPLNGDPDAGHPNAHAAPSQDRPAVDTPPPVTAPGRVLVVDDEAPVRSLTQAILGGAGYDVMTAATGAEALRLLARHEFALVITDLKMPVMSGADLFYEVRNRWPALAERMLFVTGDIEGDSGGRPLDQDEIRYLEKPFTTQQLLQAIRRVLAK